MYRENPSAGGSDFADLMDRRFTIPGTNIRYGIDAIIGLIPGIGDWLGGLAALYIPVQAVFRDVTVPVIIRMFINIIIDVLIGAIPILGDIFDFAWKANIRNARLLDQYQNDPKATNTKSHWLNWSVVIFFVLIIVLLLIFIGWIIAEILDFIF